MFPMVLEQARFFLRDRSNARDKRSPPSQSEPEPTCCCLVTTDLLGLKQLVLVLIHLADGSEAEPQNRSGTGSEFRTCQ